MADTERRKFSEIFQEEFSNPHFEDIDFDLPLVFKKSYFHPLFDNVRLNIVAKGCTCHFKNCHFKSIKLESVDEAFIEFEDCTFEEVSFKKCKSVKFKLSIKQESSVKEISISDTEFERKFYINKQFMEGDETDNELIIEELSITNTTFKDNFKLHNSKVEKLEIRNTNFEKNADFFKLTFEEISFKKCLLKDNLYIDPKSQIKKISISDTEFEGKFYINKQLTEGDKTGNELEIEELSITNTTFKDNFKLHNSKVKKLEIRSVDFEKNADFFKSTFEEMSFKKCLLKDNFYIDLQPLIKKISISETEFEGKFYINKQFSEGNKTGNELEIEELSITNTTFKNNFKLHKSEVGKLEIRNVDFEKNADFFSSIFKDNDKDIEFFSVVFNGLALFGNCEFKNRCVFKYVTFNQLAHFRKTVFEKGVNLEETNVNNNMNFFGAEVKGDNISQETYRIIKHSFQQLGNQIEASNYHMRELKEKLKIAERLDKCVLKLNWWTSRFSTNWFLPLVWIFFVGFVTCIFLSHSATHFCLNCWISGLLKYSYLGLGVDEFKGNCKYFILLFNKVSLGYLYYQFVQAVRRYTRR